MRLFVLDMERKRKQILDFPPLNWKKKNNNNTEHKIKTSQM